MGWNPKTSKASMDVKKNHLLSLNIVFNVPSYTSTYFKSPQGT